MHCAENCPDNPTPPYRHPYNYSETVDIQWFDIGPSGRLLYFSWKEISDYPPEGLATSFHDIQLTIEPGCLKLSEEDSHVCFRRK